MTLKQVMAYLKEEFHRSFGQRWEELKMDIGNFLNDAHEALSPNEAAYNDLKSWISETYGISLVAQQTCIRIANEEISEEVASRLTASLASKIHTKNVPQMDDTYNIYSPVEGRMVRKKFRDFTKDEARLNIGIHGINAARAIKTAQKPVLTAMAKSHRIENGSLILFVPSMKKEIKYRVTEKFVKELIKSLR